MTGSRRRRWLRVGDAVVAALFVLFAAALLWALPAPLPRLPAEIAARRPDVGRGRYLAGAGDCVACHTRVGGTSFAGGLPFALPMGVIYSPNITSDRDHGMGRYTLPEFVRLMRGGVARDGRRVYPAMPYTSYARLSDRDLQDLWAYFTRGVAPSAAPSRDSAIVWPLSIRWPIAFWNKAFLDDRRFRPDPARSPAWNRGAYLVQGLGHCGECHTARGIAMQMRTTRDDDIRYLAGGVLEGQASTDLRGDPASGLGRWSRADIVQLLTTGRTRHGAVTGQMAQVVVDSTQHLTGGDREAIADYLKGLTPAGEAARYARSRATEAAFLSGRARDPGARAYMDSCAACHRLDGGGAGDLIPRLAGNVSVLQASPASLVTAILAGAEMPPTKGAPSALRMPGFAWRYDDAEVAALASFVRHAWGNRARNVSAAEVRKLRVENASASARSGH